MAFKVVCPTCASWLKVATRKKGQQIQCPKCSQGLIPLGEHNVQRAAAPSTPVLQKQSSRPAYFNLVLLFLILLAFPGVWLPGLRYRAQHNDAIVAARIASESPKAKSVPIDEPKADPTMVVNQDVPPPPPIVPPPPKIEDGPKIDPDKMESTTGPSRRPKVAILEPQPPPVVAKVDDPFPLPPKLDPRQNPTPKFVPPTRPEKTAAELKAESIFDEIRRFPAASKIQNQAFLALVNGPWPKFGDEIDEYGPDGFNPFVGSGDFERLKTEYPLRVLAYEISQRLSKTSQLTIRETLSSPIDAKRKSQVTADQKAPALAILSLQEILDDAQAGADKRDKEKSKRWRAHFDLAVARLQARMIYLTEYDNALAAIKTESLPPLDGAKGWHVAPCPKVQTKEASVKDMAKQLTKAWDRIARDYPNTPWSLVAESEKVAPLGLEWIATKK